MTATPSPVTFLFTDIEGSTRLWETEPTRMADALARHDSLCRTAVATHGGRAFDVAMQEGNSMTLEGAVEYALDTRAEAG